MAVGDLGRALKSSLEAHQSAVLAAREAAQAAAPPPSGPPESPAPQQPTPR